MNHSAILCYFDHGYIYVSLIKQSGILRIATGYDYYVVPDVPFERIRVGINSAELIRQVPHVIFLGKIDYGKLFLEVAKEYDLKNFRNHRDKITFMYIEHESQQYLIQLMQEGFQSDGYECVFCGGEFECFPSLDEYMEHKQTHYNA